MGPFNLSQILSIAAFFSQLSLANPLNTSPVVSTSSGNIHGVIQHAFPNVAQFLNVPFAEPPTGNLRFAPPQPKKNAGDIEASQLGPICLQYGTLASKPPLYSFFETEFFPSSAAEAGSSEDCLSLAIWAPSNCSNAVSNKDAKLPVIIWLFGGGFTAGGIDTEYYNAAPWVQRSQQHVVVAANYRVAILGTPNAAGLAAEGNNYNFGLLDQRLAVQWVHDNIAAFGGDPDKITLWGQSSGALSSSYYDFAYPTDSLVAGFILSSGTALYPVQNTDATHSDFSSAASQFGCGSLDAAAELTCMRSVPFSKLKSYFQDPNVVSTYDYLPIDDGKTVFPVADYPLRVAANQFSRKPSIIGFTKDEGTATINSSSPNPPSANEQAQAQAVTLAGFSGPAAALTLARQTAGVVTYRYRYSGNFTDLSPLPWYGAYHASKIPLIFGTYGKHAPPTAFETKLSHYLQDLWLAFMNDPVDGPANVGWPVAELTSVLEFDPDESPDGPDLSRVTVL